MYYWCQFEAAMQFWGQLTNSWVNRPCALHFWHKIFTWIVGTHQTLENYSHREWEKFLVGVIDSSSITLTCPVVSSLSSSSFCLRDEVDHRTYLSGFVVLYGHSFFLFLRSFFCFFSSQFLSPVVFASLGFSLPVVSGRCSSAFLVQAILICRSVVWSFLILLYFLFSHLRDSLSIKREHVSFLHISSQKPSLPLFSQTPNASTWTNR